MVEMGLFDFLKKKDDAPLDVYSLEWEMINDPSLPLFMKAPIPRSSDYAVFELRSSVAPRIFSDQVGIREGFYVWDMALTTITIPRCGTVKVQGAKQTLQEDYPGALSEAQSKLFTYRGIECVDATTIDAYLEFAKWASSLEPQSNNKSNARTVSDFAASLDSLSNAVPPKPAAAENGPLEVGSIIEYGTFRGEPIRWRVLAKDGEDIELITEKAINAMPFDTRFIANLPYEMSELYAWLNGPFLRELKRSGRGYKLAADVVFCLSREDAFELFADDDDRKCRVSAAAIDEGAEVYDGGYTHWWLFEDGDELNMVSYVWYSGMVGDPHCAPASISVGVRPCIWVNQL